MTDEPRAADHEDPYERIDEDGPAQNRADVAWLLNGAQFFVDWARESVIAPHAEHGDPAEHPDCVLCRSMSALTSLRDGAAGLTPKTQPPGLTVAWIPVVRRD